MLFKRSVLGSLFGRRPVRKRVYPYRVHGIGEDRIDGCVLGIVRRLRSLGYEGYLVGGCVRDLMLGRRPKDFDVVTDARPRQVKDSFRNCRLIGRRFRLAHVHVDRDRVVEVSTFRGIADPESLPVDDRFAANNIWGTMETDAVRRDFTVNALYYDPERREVIDYVGGVDDLRRRLLRSIRDPDESFEEDPVRIVRAARFCATVGLRLSPEDLRAAEGHAALLEAANAARMLEELRKILRCGASAGVFANLKAWGVLDHWLPELGGPEVHGAMLRRLEVLDRRVVSGEVFPDELVFSVLFYDLFRGVAGPEGERGYQDTFELLRREFRALALRCQFPRWLWFGVCDICAIHYAFCRRRPPRRLMKYARHLMRSRNYRWARVFWEMDEALTGRHAERMRFWDDLERRLGDRVGERREVGRPEPAVVEEGVRAPDG